MRQSPRCLYSNTFIGFINDTDMSVFGVLSDSYHGDVNTNQRDAWKGEITLMKAVLSILEDKDGKIVFEYDIPRLGKRIDVVLLYKGIVFCVESKLEKPAS